MIYSIWKYVLKYAYSQDRSASIIFYLFLAIIIINYYLLLASYVTLMWKGIIFHTLL